ncbi:neuropeptide CCHamide-1 receptor-like [Penaeus japonicus]|uniref:neuropeptide CCHamide-1 receptor-like n=1 Tax=Penaeus japonicus TaxID=27405 RepID=UPI001C713A4E|nr:neuropeptide CCHamide-1 receptor-like [Penaeus japonicus]XP_042885592.1 neuropeptide CCHamide-1 receptor-like [Penaeus japonicus]XP_042885594.1 neuropeptide CCHamide-1 receptor-like [Penaeus japonicus]XP_042885595.1 neuropeptide CCHamide-1 receptor-like [Penaeus japonicus]
MPEMKQHGISVSSSPSPSKPEEHTPFPPFTLSPFVSHSIDPYNTTDDSHFSPHLNGSEDDGSLLLFGNGTNDTSKYVPYHQRPETYVVPVLFALIFIIGIIGNGTLIVIFAKNKTLRNVPNTYIISLALGDLLLLFSTVPLVSTIYTIDSWPYGTFECKLSDMVREISVGVTVFNLTALSADRYLAIVSPIRKAVGAAGATTVRVAVGIWLLAVVLAVPTAVFSHVQVFEVSEEKSINVCYPFPDYLPEWYPCVNILAKALVYYLLPLIVIGTFYLLMARHLLSSDVPGESHVFHKQIQTRRKVAKIVLCFVLIFAVCFLPTHVFLLWFYFDPLASVKYNEFWHSLRIVGFCLGFINSCINPIALYCISGTFRKHYNRYLFCCCCWVQPSRHRNTDSLRSTRSGMSRYRSSTIRSTLRPSETITLTTLLQDRNYPATT